MDVVINPFLEQQYNNRAAVPDFQSYLTSWKQRSTDFRNDNIAAQKKNFLNVSYGSGSRQLVDIFPAGSHVKAPVHIFLHGGYWQALDKDSFSFMAKTFNDQGECAVIVNYDLCPKVTIDQISVQIKHLLLWVIHNVQLYGGNPEQIQITGHSAGAQLLATLLTMDWTELGTDNYPFQRLNALSGLYNLIPLVSTSINQLLGLDRQTASINSPLLNELWISDTKLKLNLLVGELESLAYKQQSSSLADCWKGKLDVRLDEAGQTHHFSILDYFLTHYAR